MHVCACVPVMCDVQARDSKGAAKKEAEKQKLLAEQKAKVRHEATAAVWPRTWSDHQLD